MALIILQIYIIRSSSPNKSYRKSNVMRIFSVPQLMRERSCAWLEYLTQRNHHEVAFFHVRMWQFQVGEVDVLVVIH